MPICYGAEGATPQGIVKTEKEKRSTPGPSFGGFGGFRGFGRDGFDWWRDGGEFSRPLLANPEFDKRFKRRLAELTKSVFNEEVFGAKIDQLRKSLEPEVRLRARLMGRDEDAAVVNLDRTTRALRRHLVQRRAFVQSALKGERFDN